MKPCKILGLDIGGANTKAALLKIQNEHIIDSFPYIEYFPFWKKTINDIPKMLKRIVANVVKQNKYKLNEIDYISITITAELSDAFQTKKEGIIIILDALSKVFDISKMFFISNTNEFFGFNRANSESYAIAAANWVSTSLFLGNYIPKCILIDAGSNTIDIIPIANSVPVSYGKDDISRLMNHELIYTGGLRATIPSITHFVPYKGNKIRISFEKFALISDVHRILKNITENEYTNDTADNRSKSLDNCYARLARIICMDIKTINRDDLNLIAKFIYEKQIEIISDEIKAFIDIHRAYINEFENNPLFIITGLSAEFLIRKTLEKLGYNNIKTLEDITNIPDNISSSAFGVAGALYFQFNRKGSL
ncbi:MAG: hydantoinase/oxoprolinase family protein [Promethearchaeota archaeon]